MSIALRLKKLGIDGQMKYGLRFLCYKANNSDLYSKLKKEHIETMQFLVKEEMNEIKEHKR